jgi:hypothetical protein
MTSLLSTTPSATGRRPHRCHHGPALFVAPPWQRRASFPYRPRRPSRWSGHDSMLGGQWSAPTGPYPAFGGSMAIPRGRCSPVTTRACGRRCAASARRKGGCPSSTLRRITCRPLPHVARTMTTTIPTCTARRASCPRGAGCSQPGA